MLTGYFSHFCFLFFVFFLCYFFFCDMSRVIKQRTVHLKKNIVLLLQDIMSSINDQAIPIHWKIHSLASSLIPSWPVVKISSSPTKILYDKLYFCCKTTSLSNWVLNAGFTFTFFFLFWFWILFIISKMGIHITTCSTVRIKLLISILGSITGVYCNINSFLTCSWCCLKKNKKTT